MNEVIDPGTLLYGPRRWKKRAFERPGWKYPAMVGSSNLNVSLLAAESEPGQIVGAFIEPTQILVQGSETRRLAPYAWLEPKGRFREHRYLQVRDGSHYFSWMTGQDSCWVGHATKDGAQRQRPAIVTHSPAPIELVADGDGCWALWTTVSDEDGVARLQAQFLIGGREGIGRRVLDHFPSQESSGPTAGSDGRNTWVGWSTQGWGSQEGREIRLTKLREADASGASVQISAPGKVARLKVAVRNGEPCVCWTDPETETFYYGDAHGMHPIGSGYPEWSVLPSGEVVFAWTDWMANDGLLFASLRGNGLRPEIDSLQGLLPIRKEPESLVVGTGPDGSAKICWAVRSEGRPRASEIHCQSIRDGVPEMPERLPGVWNGGAVTLMRPVLSSGKMILPIGHSTAAAAYLWRADLNS